MSFTTRLRAHCLQPVTLSLTDTPRLETRLRAILAASTPRRVSLRGVLIIGAATAALSGLVAVVRPASPDDATPSPMYGRTVVPPGQWTATVNGVGVELLAVGTQDNGVSEMWRPDGTPLPDAWFKQEGRSFNPYPRTKRLVYFVVRTHKTPDAPGIGDAARAMNFSGHEAGGNCNSGSGPGTAYLPGGGLMKSTPDSDLMIVSGQYPIDLHKGLLQAQVTGAGWEYTQEWRNPGTSPILPASAWAVAPDYTQDWFGLPPIPLVKGEGIASKTFTPNYAITNNDGERHQYKALWRCRTRPDGVIIETTEIKHQYDSHFVLTDRRDREIHPTHWVGLQGGMMQTETYYPLKMPLKNIKVIRLKLRPYKTVEIRQVALYPNRWRGVLSRR